LQLLLQRPSDARTPKLVPEQAEGESRIERRFASYKVSLASGQTQCLARPDVPISRRYGCIPSKMRSNPYIPERMTTENGV
jgi:hypothetical protein